MRYPSKLSGILQIKMYFTASSCFLIQIALEPSCNLAKTVGRSSKVMANSLPYWNGLNVLHTWFAGLLALFSLESLPPPSEIRPEGRWPERAGPGAGPGTSGLIFARISPPPSEIRAGGRWPERASPGDGVVEGLDVRLLTTPPDSHVLYYNSQAQTHKTPQRHCRY